MLAVDGIAFAFSMLVHYFLPSFFICCYGPSPESSAIGTLRTIASVQAQYRYRSDCGDGCCPSDYAPSLAELSDVGLIDDVLGEGRKNGYVFSLSGGTCVWQASATPAGPHWGRRNFIVCTDGVVRYSSCPDPATCSSAAID